MVEQQPIVDPAPEDAGPEMIIIPVEDIPEVAHAVLQQQRAERGAGDAEAADFDGRSDWRRLVDPSLREDA